MKKLIAILSFILFAGAAFAQKDSLAFDENNKYIYYQVVQQPGLPADTMFNRALYFFKTAYPYHALKLIAADKDKGTLSGSGNFLVSKKNPLDIA